MLTNSNLYKTTTDLKIGRQRRIYNSTSQRLGLYSSWNEKDIRLWSVDVKFGRENPTETQICHAHDIHLAVTGVLYQQNIEDPSGNEELFEDENEDIDNFSDDDEYFSD